MFSDETAPALLIEAEMKLQAVFLACVILVQLEAAEKGPFRGVQRIWERLPSVTDKCVRFE